MSHSYIASTDKPRRGFTFLELVIVIVALLVMVALAAPYIVRSRENARAASCMNNQRLIAEAMLEYETFFHALPIGELKSDTADAPSFGVIPRILPLMDENALADQINWNALPINTANKQQLSSLPAPPSLHCPADNFALRDKRSLSYVINAGSDAVIAGKDTTKPEFLGAFDFGDATNTKDFEDGAASTALFCERLIGTTLASGLQTQEQGKAPRDLAALTGDDRLLSGAPDLFAAACAGVKADHRGWLTTLGRDWLLSYHYVHVLAPNSKTTDCGYVSQAPLEGIVSARSYHPGFVQLTFADGRNESVSDQIDIAIWRAYGTRSGHEGSAKP